MELTGDGASSVPRRALGRALRELRTEARMTLEGAAGALGWSRHKVWRAESGVGPARGVDVRVMCELYEARTRLTSALVALAGETGAKGWWLAYGGAIPDWFDLYAGLEAAAGRLREYQDVLVPALLQTREYATVACRHRPDGEREGVVGARLARQSLLRRRSPAPPRLAVVLSEAVLMRVVGDPATMAGQLRQLLAVGRLPHVSVRVLPLAAGPHRGAVAGAFVLLDFPPGNRGEPEAPVVYQESLSGALYLDRPKELAAYERVWASLDTLALDRDQSAQLIGKALDELDLDEC
ncbi:transcriptional regulator [Micromonospora yangpuensis]|uniref:Helix-turn-helix domain-containing protein n=1 Tax=Micromonospora yangpuensis TaxID=683228 RepID=A0A1C6U9R1_9ACTN|nr:transcriptional regulator [Micromonospora yangpuensis]SCL50762.1 Helix-turn-helix domain-containing protein [Micromonospora yangpuensis]